jgi:hypothetical protein
MIALKNKEEVQYFITTCDRSSITKGLIYLSIKEMSSNIKIMDP